MEVCRGRCGYLRRWWRVRRSIFLCFFFRMRLRRFLINEPMRFLNLPPHPRKRKIRYRDLTVPHLSGIVQLAGQLVLVQLIGVRVLFPEPQVPAARTPPEKERRRAAFYTRFP